MVDHIFRQYDIRGKVGSELYIKEVYDLVRAIACYFKNQNPNVKKIAVGADGRIHSPEIKEEVCRALQDSGIDVIFVGTCPTPVVYFSLFNLPVDGGLMITASHNGKEYNGIKICLGKDSVWGTQIQEIKHLYKQKKFCASTNVGNYTEYDVIAEYTDWLVNHFQHLVGMPLSVIIDCGNGAAGTVMPSLIKKMEWPNVSLLFEEVDGNYPNHEADPIIEKNMQAVKAAMLSENFQIGLGFDGDCDRMAPVTESGQLVSGDKLLALFAQEIIKKNSKAKIVFDIKCSSALSDLINQWGGKPCISASGHSIIKDQLKKQDALLAGELSCHFFFKDRYFGYDDGIYAALRLFELLQDSQKSLDELLTIFPQKYATPEIRIACPQEKMDEIVDSVKEYFAKDVQAEVITIDGIRVAMQHGWGLVRSSNTQPVICLRFESDSADGLNLLKKDFLQALTPYFTKEELYKELYQ
ncbi:MAG: phosphomannomutase/phosphoglucomutase [Candidatus Babeliales bacterium]